MIRFFVLGTLHFEGTGTEPVVMRQPSRLALLTYLALEGRVRCVHRDRLLGVFWPELDERRARRALNQALHVLRRCLGDSLLQRHGPDGLAAGERLWCDARAFEEACEAAQLRRALELYGGDLLGGLLPWRMSAEFEQWLEGKRLQLRRSAANAATTLAAAHERAGRDAEALALLRRAASLTPLDESVVRRLMMLLNGRGETVAAIEAYGEYSRRIRSELGLGPGPRVRRVVEEIRASSTVP